MSESRSLVILTGLICLGGLIYLLSPVLMPFLIATLLAYMGDPMVDKLDTKIPRGISVLIVFLVLTSFVLTLLFILLPMIEKQLSTFIQVLPKYFDWVQLVIVPWLMTNFGITGIEMDFAEMKVAVKEHLSNAGGVATGLLGTVSKSGMAIIGWAVNIVLVPVLTFYILRDWDILKERVLELVPRSSRASVIEISRDSDSVLSAFLRGQLMVMLVLGSIYSIGLWMIGLDFSLLIGMLAGIVSFVPYLGFIIGMLVAGVAAMVQFHDVYQLLPVLIVFGVGQLFESFLLTPMLVGDKIGLHPVAVIFAVMAGGQLFGFFGILIALPVAAVVMVLLRHVHERYMRSELYTSE